MRILYLGAASGTSLHRAVALERLGHHVRVIDYEKFVSGAYLVRKLHFETGGLLCERAVMRGVLRELGDDRYDAVWVDWGAYVGPALVKELRARHGPVINYNADDPLGGRDRFRGLLYRRTLPYYDLAVVPREQNVAEAKARGARRVLRVYFSADEVAHAPRAIPDSERSQWENEVLFIGSWMPERGPFMVELLERGVPLAIRGSAWEKSPQWNTLKAIWKGRTKTDDEYAKLIGGAKVCLGLLSKGNRDLHTQRSLEIPMIGGLFCAERTSEHLDLYREGEEAVFWSDAAECAEKCRLLLDDEPRRREIARAGHERCLANGHLNERVVSRILDEVSVADVPR